MELRLKREREIQDQLKKQKIDMEMAEARLTQIQEKKDRLAVLAAKEKFEFQNLVEKQRSDIEKD